MILITNAAHETVYQQASVRWYQLWRRILALSFALQSMISGVALYQYHQVYVQLQPLQAQAQKEYEYVHKIKQWKSAVAAYDAGKAQREMNREIIEALYKRLEDFHAVNLRLLRIKHNYIYCGIEGISETAVQQYQHYLKRWQYKPVSQQLIENIWFLEFVQHDAP